MDTDKNDKGVDGYYRSLLWELVVVMGADYDEAVDLLAEVEE